VVKEYLWLLHKNQKGGMSLEVVGFAFIGAGLLLSYLKWKKKKPGPSEKE